MEMVSGWEWLILMGGLVAAVIGGLIYTVIQEIRRK